MASFTEQDIIVLETKIDFKHKKNNPLDKVCFYKHNDCSRKVTLDKMEISNIHYNSFMDIKLMVYLRDGKDHQKREAIKHAFDKWHQAF